MENNFICKYCGRICKSIYSLRAHERFCKENPNRIIPKNTGIKPNTRKWMYKDNVSKFIKIEDIDNYLSEGWQFGFDISYKDRLSKAMTGVSTGKASTPEKEKIRREKISKTLHGNTNWMYNKKRGNSKQGWYKGIHCDSTWELAFLVYHLDNNLYIERCKERREYIFNNEKHTYIPDFITEEGIIEVKGRIDKKAIEKQKQNPDIIVYDRFKMKKFLDYVINKYGSDFYKNLYE